MLTVSALLGSRSWREIVDRRPHGRPPRLVADEPLERKYGSGSIDWNHPGVYQHIGYPSVVQLADGTILASYHELSEDERPLQYVRCTRFRLAH